MDEMCARVPYEAPEAEVLTFVMEDCILSNQSGNGSDWGTLSRRRDQGLDDFEME